MNAPLLRACVTRLRTFATERAQRGRRSFVQVCLVKSMTSSAVSFGTIVADLSAGGAGNLAVAHSSITVCPCEPVYVERRPAMVAMPTITSRTPFILHLPRLRHRTSPSYQPRASGQAHE